MHEMWPIENRVEGPEENQLLRETIRYKGRVLRPGLSPDPAMEKSMVESTKICPAALSRRSMLRRIALATGGAALVATTVTGTRTAFAKSSQKAVHYQDTPHGTQSCDNCREFEPPSACKVVDGVITPTGWCKVYIKKPAGS